MAVERRGAARGDVGEAARARELIAGDHERGRAVRPALTQIGAGRGLTHRVQSLRPHQLEQALELRRLLVARANPAGARLGHANTLRSWSSIAAATRVISTGRPSALATSRPREAARLTAAAAAR